ncbi:hypothetical protein KR038_011719 [Drosophila bunnanda]|nr:hypothetical protein KR038_011719 [Drosophila bunnanda]
MSQDQTGTEDIYVHEAHIHKEYAPQTNVNDIALLRLSRCVSYRDRIQPICIQLDPRRKSHMDNAINKFTAVGWGQTRSQATSNVLQTVTLDRLPKSRCDDHFWNNDRPTQFCAGSSRGADTCGGDSGGPLYTTGRYAGVRRQTQLGIISYGTKLCQGVGVYTDVMSYGEWIEEIVLESDIEVILPKMDFLDRNCIDTESGTYDFPWLVHVYIDASLIALGTLISDSLYLKVGLGKNNEDTEVFYKVESVIKHPDFVQYSVNDIALLKLAVKVEYKDHIRPICMPFLNQTTAFREKAVKAEDLTVIGFAFQSSEVVQRLNSTNCYNMNYQKIGEKQICFRHPQSIGLASGSPLVREFAYGNTLAYTLVGMASFGVTKRQGPEVYTDVLSYSEWIKGLIDNNG